MGNYDSGFWAALGMHFKCFHKYTIRFVSSCSWRKIGQDLDRIAPRSSTCPTLMTGNCAVSQADGQTRTTATNHYGHKIIIASTIGNWFCKFNCLTANISLCICICICICIIGSQKTSNPEWQGAEAIKSKARQLHHSSSAAICPLHAQDMGTWSQDIGHRTQD